ncbi:MAG TPA: DUF1634 domain-containing protein [Streptosporangiaceae bacterium]|nr:DUF1634 domain-containing protein [Streptosporangiaceae bacterium]
MPPVELLVARTLLVGGLVGIALILVGGALYATHGGFHHHVLALNRPPTGRPAGVFASVRQVVEALRDRPIDPLAVTALGLVALMVTPAVAIAVAIPGFWWTGDRRYTVIAIVVLSMLGLSALLTGSVH